MLLAMDKFFKNRNAKLSLALAGALYVIYYIHTRYDWHLIDAADLGIHELGHNVFAPFGWTMHVAGGELLQTLVPFAFFIYFFFYRQLYSAAAMLYWLACSMTNVAVYAGDAVVEQLPLLGDDGSKDGHDWNNLLFHYGLLHQTDKIAAVILDVAVIILIVGITISIYAWNRGKEQVQIPK